MLFLWEGKVEDPLVQPYFLGIWDKVTMVFDLVRAREVLEVFGLGDLMGDAHKITREIARQTSDKLVTAA